jgi:L,D-transpeptidase YcbB
MRICKPMLAAAVVLASLTAANANETITGDRVAKPARPAAEQIIWTAGDDLQVGLLREITARKIRKPDETKSYWLDELGTLYAAHLSQPLWIEGNAPSPRARRVMRDFAHADEWGLRPSDYRFDLPAQFVDERQKIRFELNFSLNLLKYVDHARRGRFRPTEMSLWYERSSNRADNVELLPLIAQADDPSGLLAAQHPPHAGFKQLREVYLRRKFPDRFEPIRAVDRGPKPIILEYGPSLRRGERHPQIALLRKRLKVPASSLSRQDLYDRKLMKAVNRFMRTQGWRRKHVYDDKVRRALNETVRGPRKRARGRVSLEDIVANMEKWRWLPRELGDIHIWNNLPSFRTQVVKNDKVIHEERIIIGKTKTQTPVFSDTMTHVVFKPQWGIPNSIKIKDLLPRLAGGDLDVLRRRGMRIQFEDKVVSPHRYNWNSTDIKSIPIVMGAGSSNPLGRVKFMFPNHHAVYMHDTPSKHLFKSRTRTFSHGCIRVRNPVRLAEIVLGETSNWDEQQVADHLRRRAKENNRVDLHAKVGVHNTYFTVIADQNGKLETLDDIYGHDRRLKQALAGKSLQVIARSDPARIHNKEIARLEESRPRYGGYGRRNTYAAGYFSNNQYALGGPSFFYGQPKPKKYKYKKKKKKASQGWTFSPFGNPFDSD